MSQLCSRTRSRTFALALVLIVTGVMAAACVPAAPATPVATSTLAATATSAPTASPIATATPQAPAARVDLPAGVDADGNFYQGDPKAPVTLVEFSDFQCPYCSRHVAETGPQIDAMYVATGQVLHVFRNFPLDIHPNAQPAAKAAYCAGQQAPKYFWGMHDWLFANQNTWSSDQAAASQFRSQALALGVDGAEYDTCLGDPATEARIQQDLDDGMNMGIQGTPAFFVNDWFISGAYPFSEFQDKISKAQQGAHPAPTATPFPTPTPLPEGANFYDPDPQRPGLAMDGSPSLGDANAPLLMLQFEDLKEPDVAQYAKDTEAQLQNAYVKTGKMRIVYKIFPTNAPEAAVAAQCAAFQSKFWEYRGVLLSKQTEWQDGDNAAMIGYARELGLDDAKFTQCLADTATRIQVDVSAELGNQVGVPSVPAFLVVDLRQMQAVASFLGPQTFAEFDAKLQEVLNPPTPATATPAP